MTLTASKNDKSIDIYRAAIFNFRNYEENGTSCFFLVFDLRSINNSASKNAVRSKDYE